MAQPKLKIRYQPIVSACAILRSAVALLAQVDAVGFGFLGVRVRKQATQAASRGRLSLIGRQGHATSALAPNPYVIILNLAFSRRLGQGRILDRVNPIFFDPCDPCDSLCPAIGTKRTGLPKRNNDTTVNMLFRAGRS